MGDQLVIDILDSLDDLIFANGLTGIYPIVDAIVNNLRQHGMSDTDIRSTLIMEIEDDA